MTATTIQGELTGKGKSFAVVGARWNALFADSLVSGAVQTLLRYGARGEDVTIVRVPGSFELPLTVSRLAKLGRYHAIIAVGVLIEGETDHYQLIASQVTSGIAQVMHETGVPVGFGVITAKTMEQAMARAGSKGGNLGEQAALAALEMANLFEKLAE